MNPPTALIKEAIAEGDQKWQDRFNCEQLPGTEYKLVSKATIDWWNETLSRQNKEIIKEKQYSGQLIYKVEELQRCKARLERADTLIFGSTLTPTKYRHEYTVGVFTSHPQYRGWSFRQFYESKDWKVINWVGVFGSDSSRAWVRDLSKYVTDRAFVDGAYIMEEGVSSDDVTE